MIKYPVKEAYILAGIAADAEQIAMFSSKQVLANFFIKKAGAPE